MDTDNLTCSICGKPIPDPCQAHYGDDGGPICTGCVGKGMGEIVQPELFWEVKISLPELNRLIDEIEIRCEADERLVAHVGEW
jgi:hypothetical protein